MLFNFTMHDSGGLLEGQKMINKETLFLVYVIKFPKVNSLYDSAWWFCVTENQNQTKSG